MPRLAEEHRKTFPNKSREQAYVAVYEDPQNVPLKQRMQQENWSLAGLGDTEYMRTQNAPYSNPHHPGVSTPRAGSGPRP